MCDCEAFLAEGTQEKIKYHVTLREAINERGKLDNFEKEIPVGWMALRNTHSTKRNAYIFLCVRENFTMPSSVVMHHKVANVFPVNGFMVNNSPIFD